MKYLKRFENFTADENSFTGGDQNRGYDATFDHSNNPVIKEKAKEYVQSVLHSNKFKKIFDDLGKEIPKDLKADEMDGMFDDIEEEAVNFYAKNPERMIIDIGDGHINNMAITGGNVGNALTSNTPVITHT